MRVAAALPGCAPNNALPFPATDTAVSTPWTLDVRCLVQPRALHVKRPSLLSPAESLTQEAASSAGEPFEVLHVSHLKSCR